MMYRYNEFDERRVVIYARVSTEHEAQISALSNQLEWYQQYLDHHPEWNLIDRYIDEGITGTSAEKRPGFTQMIADAKAHKFDLIITREVSRFARNTEETLHFTKMLRRIGVEVFFINDNTKVRSQFSAMPWSNTQTLIPTAIFLKALLKLLLKR